MVPDHWSLQPLKTIADFTNGEAFKPTEWTDSGIPIIRIQNLNGGDEFNYFDGEVDTRYHILPGDLLFGWSGNRGTSFGPFRWSRAGLHYLNQHIFKVSTTADFGWLYWCLKAVTVFVEQQAHGIIGMVHVTKGRLGGVYVPLPSTDEQSAIAAFLDRETSKIDALVDEQRLLIELLKEKRQALISHTVTKGLSGSVPMKDSGIEWLGQVPAHWGVGTLIRVAERVIVGIAEAAVHAYADVGIPILRSANIRAGKIIGEMLYVNPEYAAQRSSKSIRAGDLITVRTGHAGVTAVISEELDECHCFTMLITSLSKTSNSDYYCHWLNSAVAKHCP